MKHAYRRILGLSAYYHDSAAALISDGRIVAAAQEERFSRRKSDEGFPAQAVAFCLRQAGLRPSDIDAVVFYDKPIIKFTRMLETFLSVAPKGVGVFARSLPSWLTEKLNLRGTLRSELGPEFDRAEILFTEHHQAHAASAFYPSPYEEAAILTVDGAGEWATTVIGSGRGAELKLHKEIRFPHSLGLLYSAFTAYCGFRINSGEYKLMGLAPYGEPRYEKAIRDHLIQIRDDGSFRLNMDYFGFLTGLTMDNSRFRALLGGPPRDPEAPMEERFLHIARSIQVVTEDIMVRLARHARDVTGLTRLCMAGGVALNCVANGQILREKIFESIWIQPASGDAGGALGAALQIWHQGMGKDRKPVGPDSMQGSLLGPEFTQSEIEAALRKYNAVWEVLEEQALVERTAGLLEGGSVIGWVQGRMEFGPRALGNRSILGDARSRAMQSVMNLKVKFRESFRPFAPIVKHDRVQDYFDLEGESPYMLIVAPVKESMRLTVEEEVQGLDRLKQARSLIPAVTHVDFSARIQTVRPDSNPLLFRLLNEFERRTGCATLVNTSFNVRGEPIVCSPDDAYRCFVNTQMDYLVIGNCILERTRQPTASVERPVAPQRD
ncbi:MAG: carbamoyltransferase [Verrucomicrobia bacterium]|nr:carbamoyltransferase [Verrucomicrobiota bacterium]